MLGAKLFSYKSRGQSNHRARAIEFFFFKQFLRVDSSTLLRQGLPALCCCGVPRWVATGLQVSRQPRLPPSCWILGARALTAATVADPGCEEPYRALASPGELVFEAFHVYILG